MLWAKSEIGNVEKLHLDQFLFLDLQSLALEKPTGPLAKP